jgi:hypothetical protein
MEIELVSVGTQLGGGTADGSIEWIKDWIIA